MAGKADELAYKLDSNEQMTTEDRKLAAKIVRAFGQHFFDRTGSMFICGAGKECPGGLPDHIVVCATYGSDATAVYMRRT